ncbi:Ldh family oxidoreductase, partial [Candidatus Bathyarchaeota archaeon]|nr:Ldh family oxidoreductase [Candidatus Bathyarchaeota archaeon]
PMLGTNPFTWAMPTDEDFPFVLDCATSIIQRGKVEMAERAGTQLAENLVIGSDGSSLTDPPSILEKMVEGKAALLPLGGKGEEHAGYKGYGYATIVELLSAAFSAGTFLKGLSGLDEKGNKVHFRVGHFFMAIDPEGFMGLKEFRKTAGDIVRDLRAAKKAPGQERIFTAGQKEHEARAVVQERGIPVNKSLASKLILIKKELDLSSYTFPFDE